MNKPATCSVTIWAREARRASQPPLSSVRCNLPLRKSNTQASVTVRGKPAREPTTITLNTQSGASIGDYDLIEANEAFAVQALADGKSLGWDWDRVNVNGGAVALGHPIGASGARVLTTLLYAMQDRDATTGLATLCLGGGNAVALSVERV